MEKSLDSHGRWRKKIVAFRVSEEEATVTHRHGTRWIKE